MLWTPTHPLNALMGHGCEWQLKEINNDPLIALVLIKKGCTPIHVLLVPKAHTTFRAHDGESECRMSTYNLCIRLKQLDFPFSIRLGL